MKNFIFKLHTAGALTLVITTGCSSPQSHEPNTATAKAAATSSACHLSFLPDRSASWSTNLDNIRRPTNPTDYAMDSTANEAAVRCADTGAIATISGGADPIELLADDYHYDISYPYAFGRFTQGCLALDGSAGQNSIGLGDNGCSTLGYGADTKPRYLSTHYGDWNLSQRYTHPLIISVSNGDVQDVETDVSSISIRYGAVDVYVSSGADWALAAENLTGEASLSVKGNKIMIVSAGAGPGASSNVAPAAIDDIILSWPEPTVTKSRAVPRVVDLVYPAPGDRSHVTYDNSSYTGSNVETSETSSWGTDITADFGAEVFGESNEIKYKFGVTAGHADRTQFTVTNEYSVQSSDLSAPHSADRFYIWTNAATETTVYHDGRKAGAHLVPYSGAIHIEAVTALQLQNIGTVSCGSDVVGSMPCNFRLAELTPEQAQELLAIDPFVGTSFQPDQDPKRFAYQGHYDLQKNPAIPDDGITSTLVWDHSHDQSLGSQHDLEITTVYKAKVEAFGANGSLGFGDVLEWQYEHNETFTTGASSSASVTLDSKFPGMHFGTDVYIDSIFNTYVFGAPTSLSDGTPLGYTGLPLCPDYVYEEDSGCECHLDSQCPQTACDTNGTWTCRSIVRSWGFEDGSKSGFYVDPNWGNPTSDLSLTYHQAYEGSGSQSLAVSFNRYVGIRVPLRSDGGTVDLTGKKLRARVFIDGPPFPNDSDDYMSAGITTAFGDVSDIGEVQNLVAGQWFTLETDIANLYNDPGDLTRSTELFLRVRLTDSSRDWSGTAEFDTIQIY